MADSHIVEYVPYTPELPALYRAPARRGPVIFKGDGTVYWPLADGSKGRPCKPASTSRSVSDDA
jgi:hypothetical protein